MQLQQPDHCLQINKADTNQNVQIQYKSILNPQKTLGYYKAPAGTSNCVSVPLPGPPIPAPPTDIHII
eukprot:4255504-Ditylum_brightwellii.AAC.1